MTALDVEVEQTGQGEIGVLDHVHVQKHIDSSDLVDVVLGQGQRGIGPQCGPLGALEIEVSRLAHSDQATSRPVLRRTDPNPRAILRK